MQLVEQKQKTLNIRLSIIEKENLDKRSKDKGLKLSEYVRSILFSDVTQNEAQSNEDVIQILKSELEEKNKQIETLQELLKNQQILSLEANKEKALVLEDKRGFWSRLFRRGS